VAAVTVNLALDAVDASGAVRLLAASLYHFPVVVDAPRLLADVLAREADLSTFLGNGLALPHARTDAVKARVVAVGRSSAGVPFGSRGELAHLIVLVGCPRAEVNAYLAFSKDLLGRLRHRSTFAQLLTSPDPAVFLKLLGLEAEPSAPGPSAS
jgi:mannitol/fructose-specific phosphotransferase system IIA component (Ntr-type)